MCKYGNDCAFVHWPEEQRTPDQNQRPGMVPPHIQKQHPGQPSYQDPSQVGQPPVDETVHKEVTKKQLTFITTRLIEIHKGGAYEEECKKALAFLEEGTSSEAANILNVRRRCGWAEEFMRNRKLCTGRIRRRGKMSCTRDV